MLSVLSPVKSARGWIKISPLTFPSTPGCFGESGPGDNDGTKDVFPIESKHLLSNPINRLDKKVNRRARHGKGVTTDLGQKGIGGKHAAQAHHLKQRM